LIYAFVEDGTLELIADAGEARRRYEGVDVEAGVVTFYDETGAPLQAVFSVPNRAGKTLGLLPWVESGVFDLVQATNPAGDSFALALAEAVSLEPNLWFRTLDDLRAHARAKGLTGDPL
jgi:hypothetical protein